MKTITFVVPLYNEEKRVGKTFKALNKLSLPVGLKLDKVIFVSDGSKDKTVALLNGYKKKSKIGRNIKIVSYKVNQGKGYAIRTGMLESNADYTLFFDADMSTPLSEIEKFVPFFNQEIDVVVGTRKNGHSTVIKHQPKLREFLGKCFTKITQIALNTNVTDFTCGFKAFSKRSLNAVFQNAIINGWGYDAEIIFLAKKYDFSIAEKAVTWANDERTKVKIYKAVPQTLKELAIIRWNHSIKPVITENVNMQKNFISKLASSI